MRYYLFAFLLFTSLLQGQNTLGTLINEPSSFDGYTLFGASPDSAVYLINNCGEVVHSWQSSYRPRFSVYLLENGNLLRTAKKSTNPIFQQGGAGGHLELFNWDGDLIWSWDYNDSLHLQHHDIEPLPNGNILVLATKYHSKEEAILQGRDSSLFDSDSSLWSEEVIEIEPIGTDSARIVWRWDSWDHLVQDYDSTMANYGNVADAVELMNINFVRANNYDPDWLHFNAVDYNPELDQILLTSRFISEVWIIDHSTTTAEAASHAGGNSGKGGDILFRWGNPQVYQIGNANSQQLFGPHDARWIPQGHPNAGKILIFNNNSSSSPTPYSQVFRIAPPVDAQGNYNHVAGNIYQPSVPEKIYDLPFKSTNTSGAHSLENGNILTCQGPQGTFIELTEQDSTVWYYVNPISSLGILSQGDPATSGRPVFRATRYAPDYPAFDGRTLTPGQAIELNPNTNTCQLFTAHPSVAAQTNSWNFYPNPSSTSLFVEHEFSASGSPQLSILNTQGQLMYQQTIEGNPTQIQLPKLNSGMYFIRLAGQTKKLFIAQ